MDTMDAVQEKFLVHQQLKFPDDCADEELSEIHMQIAEYDGYIAGIIDQLLKGGTLAKEKLFYQPIIEDKLNTIIQKGKQPTAHIAKEYREYLFSLKGIVEAAKTVA